MFRSPPINDNNDGDDHSAAHGDQQGASHVETHGDPNIPVPPARPETIYQDYIPPINPPPPGHPVAIPKIPRQYGSESVFKVTFPSSEKGQVTRVYNEFNDDLVYNSEISEQEQKISAQDLLIRFRDKRKKFEDACYKIIEGLEVKEAPMRYILQVRQYLIDHKLILNQRESVIKTFIKGGRGGYMEVLLGKSPPTKLPPKPKTQTPRQRATTPTSQSGQGDDDEERSQEESGDLREGFNEDDDEQLDIELARLQAIKEEKQQERAKQQQKVDKDLFCDATIVCKEQKQIRVHKLILSRCSSYFKNIFKQKPNNEAFIIIPHAELDDVKVILDFIYKGESYLPQSRRKRITKLLKEFKITGRKILFQHKNKEDCTDRENSDEPSNNPEEGAASSEEPSNTDVNKSTIRNADNMHTDNTNTGLRCSTDYERSNTGENSANFEPPIIGRSSAHFDPPITGDRSSANYEAPVTGDRSSANFEPPITGDRSSANFEPPIPGDRSSANFELPITGDRSSANYEAPITGDRSSANFEPPITGDRSYANFEPPIPGNRSYANFEPPIPGDRSSANFEAPIIGDRGSANFKPPISGERSSANFNLSDSRNTFKCRYCKNRFKNRAEYMMHQHILHQVKWEKLEKKMKKLEKKLGRPDSRNTFKCRYCKKRFKNRAEYMMHQHILHQVKWEELEKKLGRPEKKLGKPEKKSTKPKKRYVVCGRKYCGSYAVRKLDHRPLPTCQTSQETQSNFTETIQIEQEFPKAGQFVLTNVPDPSLESREIGQSSLTKRSQFSLDSREAAQSALMKRPSPSLDSREAGQSALTKRPNLSLDSREAGQSALTKRPNLSLDSREAGQSALTKRPNPSLDSREVGQSALTKRPNPSLDSREAGQFALNE